jgi:hypothetical protein
MLQWDDVVRERVATMLCEAEREIGAGYHGTERLEARMARKLAAFRAELPALHRDWRRRRAGIDELLLALDMVAPAPPPAEVRIAV